MAYILDAEQEAGEALADFRRELDGARVDLVAKLAAMAAGLDAAIAGIRAAIPDVADADFFVADDDYFGFVLALADGCDLVAIDKQQLADFLALVDRAAGTIVGGFAAYGRRVDRALRAVEKALDR